MSADFTPDFKDYNVLKPFRFWCQKVLPLTYDDSLSYYEVLCKVKDYLNNTIEDVGNLEDNVQSVYDAFVALQDWVNDYFDNLDLTEELTPIVRDELETVLGDVTYDSNSKTAILVPGSGSPTNNPVENLQILNNYPIADAGSREWIGNFNFTPKRMYKKAIFIGDSYLDGWTPDGNVTSWGVYLAGLLGLAVDASAFIYSQGGAGFVTTNNDRNFVTMLSEAVADARFTNDSIDLIIVGGGFNDQYAGYSDIVTRISQFANTAKTNFPNARVYVANMTFSQIVAASRSTYYYKVKVANAYADGCAQYGLMPFTDCWMALWGKTSNADYCMSSDDVHPNDIGQQYLARALEAFITTGSYIKHPGELLNTNPTSSIYAAVTPSGVTPFLTGPTNITGNLNATSGKCNGTELYLDLHPIKGFEPVTDNKCWGSAILLMRSSEGYRFVNCIAGTAGGRIRIYPLDINTGKTDYLTLTNITYAGLYTISMFVPAYWC